MAIRTIKYDAFKRGDTPVFRFEFTEPSVGYDWTGVTLDAAITNVAAPSDNTGAGVLRTTITPSVDGNNTAYYELQPTVSESNALVVGKYKVEVQLKSGGTNVATAVTGSVEVVQDYII